jgi:hypothetical protein
MTPIPLLDEIARFVIRSACVNPRTALHGFRHALSSAACDFEELFRAKALTESGDEAVASAIAAALNKQLWPQIMMELAALELAQEIKIPLDMWREEAAKLGRATGEKIALHGPMPEKEGRRICSDLKKATRQRAKEIMDGWPLSREVRAAVVTIMVKTAEGTAISVLERVSPDWEVVGRVAQ